MNKLKLFFMLLFFSIFFSSSPIYAQATAIPATQSSVSPYSDNIRWLYKSINGVLYKRQYNYTQQKWIGSWVKA